MIFHPWNNVHGNERGYRDDTSWQGPHSPKSTAAFVNDQPKRDQLSSLGLRVLSGLPGSPIVGGFIHSCHHPAPKTGFLVHAPVCGVSRGTRFRRHVCDARITACYSGSYCCRRHRLSPHQPRRGGYFVANTSADERALQSPRHFTHYYYIYLCGPLTEVKISLQRTRRSWAGPHLFSTASPKIKRGSDNYTLWYKGAPQQAEVLLRALSLSLCTMIS